MPMILIMLVGGSSLTLLERLLLWIGYAVPEYCLVVHFGSLLIGTASTVPTSAAMVLWLHFCELGISPFAVTLNERSSPYVFGVVYVVVENLPGLMDCPDPRAKELTTKEFGVLPLQYGFSGVNTQIVESCYGFAKLLWPSLNIFFGTKSASQEGQASWFSQKDLTSLSKRLQVKASQIVVGPFLLLVVLLLVTLYTAAAYFVPAALQILLPQEDLSRNSGL
ncbi:hypothetical protein Tco_1121263 [Tanacetum coccineum]|uniref:Uncharacterized protein n=1 Tax=Tanacetum coccineum TaxID=301880 RepID=A0ABQ5J051_9ASTR